MRDSGRLAKMGNNGKSLVGVSKDPALMEAMFVLT
jgi:hypothetical protein